MKHFRQFIAVTLVADGILRLALGKGFHDFFVLLVLAVLYAKTSRFNISGEDDDT